MLLCSEKRKTGKLWGSMTACAAALRSIVTCYAAILDRVGDRPEKRETVCDEVSNALIRLKPGSNPIYSSLIQVADCLAQARVAIF